MLAGLDIVTYLLITDVVGVFLLTSITRHITFRILEGVLGVLELINSAAVYYDDSSFL